VPPLALTIDKAAEALGVSPSTVRRLIASGRLPTVPNLSPTRVAVSALRRFTDGEVAA
jgi:predicted site-specific integrase-resolvase